MSYLALFTKIGTGEEKTFLRNVLTRALTQQPRLTLVGTKFRLVTLMTI